EKLEIARKNGKLQIGIPRETHLQEKRVCLTPDAVEVLVANDHQVIVESNAGEGAQYSDREYSEAGAKISQDVKEVFAQPLVLKVEPPTEEELKLLQPNAFLISAVQPSTKSKSYFEHRSE